MTINQISLWYCLFVVLNLNKKFNKVYCKIEGLNLSVLSLIERETYSVYILFGLNCVYFIGSLNETLWPIPHHLGFDKTVLTVVHYSSYISDESCKASLGLAGDIYQAVYMNRKPLRWRGWHKRLYTNFVIIF